MADLRCDAHEGHQGEECDQIFGGAGSRGSQAGISKRRGGSWETGVRREQVFV